MELGSVSNNTGIYWDLLRTGAWRCFTWAKALLSLPVTGSLSPALPRSPRIDCLLALALRSMRRIRKLLPKVRLFWQTWRMSKTQGMWSQPIHLSHLNIWACHWRMMSKLEAPMFSMVCFLNNQAWSGEECCSRRCHRIGPAKSLPIHVSHWPQKCFRAWLWNSSFLGWYVSLQPDLNLTIIKHVWIYN